MSSMSKGFLNSTILTFISKSEDIDEEDQYVPYNERPETYIVPILFCIILVVGVAGNGVLVLTLLRHTHMRNIPNTYVLSLAFGDLLVILLAYYLLIKVFFFFILQIIKYKKFTKISFQLL